MSASSASASASKPAPPPPSEAAEQAARAALFSQAQPQPHRSPAERHPAPSRLLPSHEAADTSSSLAASPSSSQVIPPAAAIVKPPAHAAAASSAGSEPATWTAGSSTHDDIRAPPLSHPMPPFSASTTPALSEATNTKQAPVAAPPPPPPPRARSRSRSRSPTKKPRAAQPPPPPPLPAAPSSLLQAVGATQSDVAHEPGRRTTPVVAAGAAAIGAGETGPARFASEGGGDEQQGQPSSASSSWSSIVARGNTPHPATIPRPTVPSAPSSQVAPPPLSHPRPHQNARQQQQQQEGGGLCVLLQPLCALHRYERTTDASLIVERPERLRAFKVGVAGAYARLESERLSAASAATATRRQRRTPAPPLPSSLDVGARGAPDSGGELLDGLLGKLAIHDDSSSSSPDALRRVLLRSSSTTQNERDGDFGADDDEEDDDDASVPFDVLETRARASIDSAALSAVHPRLHMPHDVDGLTGLALDAKDEGDDSSGAGAYARRLAALCAESRAKIKKRQSEIPEHLPQGDLYLCPGSEDAIFGALAAACEAVDHVIVGRPAAATATPTPASYKHAFAAIRPPGHVSATPLPPHVSDAAHVRRDC